MRHLMLSAATIVLALGVTACEREVRTSESKTVIQPAPSAQKETIKEKETVVVKPDAVPGPAGPAGPAGPKGEPGKPGGDTVVIVPPAAEPKKY